LVTDEEQVREMEFIDAATEYVHAEKRRVVALSNRQYAQFRELLLAGKLTTPNA
jgi:hypothetical protein